MELTVSQQEPITIGLVQMAMTGDADENLAKALTMTERAASMGAQVVCLPELFRSPYFCLTPACETDYVETLPGTAGQQLSDCAKKNGVTLIAGSLYEQKGSERFNTSMVFDSQGTLIGEYRKTHIPHDPGFYEQNYFISGGSNYQVFTTKVGGRELKVGVLICYDQWFPEAARTLALMGADIIFYPTAIGTVKNMPQIEGNWGEAWKAVQRGHAVANNLIVAAVNRVGEEGDTTFWGGSFISNAFGHILAEGSCREEIVIGTIDLAHSRHVRESWRFFKERRPDTYGMLTRG